MQYPAALAPLAYHTVTGNGVDDIGQYAIGGVFFGGRVAFGKQYVSGSVNVDGRFRVGENLGHCVEYHGSLAGPTAAEGVKGDWYVKTDRYTGRGDFHIWPENAAATAPVAPTGKSFCALCFMRWIDIVLEPCGHIAVCSACSAAPGFTQCPICRASVSRRGPAMAMAGFEARQVARFDAATPLVQAGS